jgi:phosphatidate cytidylyltransferase
VAGETRNGDELFEDLDKFFAPIQDVDWDEPEEPSGRSPHEEHVDVRGGESVPEHQTVPVPDLEDVEESPRRTDEAWTTSDAAEDAIDGPEFDDAERVVLVEDDDGPDVPVVSPGQEDLFGTDDAADAVDAQPDPSDEDLEAAAEHFAGAFRDDETYETEPIDVFGEQAHEREPEGSDLLAELGATDDVEREILGDLEQPQAPRTVVVGAEGMSGPSWQDVAAVEVGADTERRGPNVGERDVPAAFMTGLMLGGIALVALWIGQGAFAIVATVAILVAQGELFGVMVKHRYQPATAVGLVAGALMMAGAYFRGESATPAMFALGVVAAFVWYMAVPTSHRTEVLRNVGLTVLNMAWIPLLAGYLIATLKLSDGRALVVAIVGLTFLFDATGFFVGSVWGGSFFQRPLAPSISPKKSIEGLIGATLVTIVVSVALLPSFIDRFLDHRADALLLAIVIAIAATLGDLAESLVKRDLGVKDMGSVLPGHGGVLDRIDSLLFVAPAAFLLFRVLFA